jgi:hypothetical protein
MKLDVVRLNGNNFSGSLDLAFCSQNPVGSLIADCLDFDKTVECTCCKFCCNADGLACTSTVPDPGSGTSAPNSANQWEMQLYDLLQPISGPALDDPYSSQSKVLRWMAQADPNPPDLVDSVSAIQRYILILIYVAAGGVDWEDSSGWLIEANACNWVGISCSNDENLVVAIELGSHKLHGTLVREIGYLAPSLETLILRDNVQLSGGLPSEIGLLTSLTLLDISNCRFSGPLPPEIGNLSNVVDFRVDNNLFSGSIPTAIMGMASATSVSLGSNMFTGEIPASIANIGTLQALKMKNCQFSGPIPTEISALDRLSTLDLSQNALDGGIPSAFGVMSLLENLYLGRDDSGSFESLESVVLQASPNIIVTFCLSDGNSGIKGTIPEELAFLPRLKEFYVHGTAIIGNLDLLFCTGEVSIMLQLCGQGTKNGTHESRTIAYPGAIVFLVGTSHCELSRFNGNMHVLFNMLRCKRGELPTVVADRI